MRHDNLLVSFPVEPLASGALDDARCAANGFCELMFVGG